MKRWLPAILLVSLPVLLLLRSLEAQAITLPDTAGSCNNGPNPCFKITNTSTQFGSSAIEGATSFCGGFGIYGLTADGVGVEARATGSGTAIVASFGTSGGSSISGTGILASSTSGAAISATSTYSANGGAAGIYASGGTLGNSGYGVRGLASGTGIGIYGDNLDDSTGWAGYFTGGVSARSYTITSDRRAKKDIKDLSYGAETLARLRPVTFRWRSQGDGAPTEVGLIAQEVEKVLPAVVRHDGRTGLLSVNYPALIPVLIKTVAQQQDASIARDARIAGLEQRRPGRPWSSGLGMGLAFALVPMGLLAARRKQLRAKGGAQ